MHQNNRTERHELGVTMIVYRYAQWSEIVATGPYTDRASIFDHAAFDDRTARRELRYALRRHARAVKAIAEGRRSAF